MSLFNLPAAQGRIQYFVKGDAPSMDKTLSGKPNIMTTALRLLYIHVLTIFYIIILTPLAKNKNMGATGVVEMVDPPVAVSDT